MNFELGSVVVPATDGTLSELGYDHKKLGLRLLGIIIEEGSHRSQVHFPELRMTLWLEHKEIKDIDDEKSEDFVRVQNLQDTKLNQQMNVFLIRAVAKEFRASHILGLEHGKLGEIWEESKGQLSKFYSGDGSAEAMRLSLGLEELQPDHWKKLEAELGPRLLIARFLPSGMHKMEVSLYLKNE